MNITPAIRATIHSIVEASREYDVSTMCIHHDGIVTAHKEADKKFTKKSERLYYLVGHVTDMIDEDGSRRAGWS